MTLATYRQVVYLYHLPLEKSLRLGPLTIWPYYSTRNTFIKDASVRKHLDRLFLLMCDCRNRPLKHIAVVSLGDFPDFKPYSEEVISQIRNIVNALFLSAAVENSSVAAVSSENFRLIVQNFQPGSDRYAIDDGSYVRISIGGLRLKDAGVRLTPRITQLDRLVYDENLLSGCIQCLETGTKKFCEQIFSSLQWISYSYDNTPGFPYHNRILLLIIAFEILAAVPGSLTKKKFTKWLEKTWNIPESEKYKLSKQSEECQHGYVGWWGEDFYQLRNDIIHQINNGELPTYDEFNREYFKTGIYIFSECVKEVLCKAGFFTMPEHTNIVRVWRLAKKEKPEDLSDE